MSYKVKVDASKPTKMPFEPQGLTGNAICDDRKPKEKPAQ